MASTMTEALRDALDNARVMLTHCEPSKRVSLNAYINYLLGRLGDDA